MGKFTFGDGQYVIYAENKEQAISIARKELQRVSNIKEKMASLLSKDGTALQNFKINTSDENLNIHFNDETSLIYDDPENATTKGEVRQRSSQNGDITYDLAYRYPEIDGHNADFRLAHEMGHLMLNPSNNKMQTYDEKTDSRTVAGLIRVPRGQETNRNAFYGEQIQENAINLLAQLAIRGEHSADDILTSKVDMSEFNSYKKADDLVKLLAVSMRNDYDKEISFEQLVENKIDSFIEHSDGTKEPANTFFYGILNDSSIVEKEFDKYMGKGAWRDLDTFIKILHNPNVNKEQFEMVSQEAQGMIKDFANARMREKYKEAVKRNDGFNIPSLENKTELINEMTGEIERQQTVQENSQEINMPQGYSINEFGEIIRPARDERQETTPQSEEKTTYTNTRYGAVLNSNSYSKHLQPITQQENKLSFKQRVAQFLQKRGLFMNLSFVENFVDKQLHVLPEATQEARTETTTQQRNSTREDFINQLTNFGAYRNLPPIQRMSDPQRMEAMKRKMEQKQQNDDEREI